MRLTEIGREIGLVNDKRYKIFKKKLKQINEVYAQLKTMCNPTKLTPLFTEKNESLPHGGLTLKECIKRNNITIFDIKSHFNLFENIPNNILDYVNTEIKYEGYIKKELEQIEKQKKTDTIALPNIDYAEIGGLRLEARQKLNKFKPATIGSAKRIDGVSPSDINVLLVYLKMKGLI